MHLAKDLGQKKMKASDGQDVDVATKQIDDDLVVFEITATVGTHVEVQRHAIGVGGTNPVQPASMTPAQLQGALDGFRQIVADNAAWHAAMDVAASGVK